MKKIASILVIAVSALSGISNAWAAGCAIKEAPSPALRNYIKGLDNLISEAVRLGGTGNCNSNAEGNRNATSDVDKAQSSVMGSVNKSLNTSNVVTSFRYTVNLVRRTELPAGIRRDSSLLDQRQRTLIAAIDSTASSCGSDVVFDSEVSPFPPYSTKGKKVGDVLADALSNHTNVMEAYREAVLGDEPVTVTDLSLVPPGFIDSLKDAYGPKAMEACNTSGEGTFFEKMKQAIDRIGNIGNTMQNGTQDWKDAWAMMQGSHKQQDKLEKQLLRQELSRQGLSTSSSERAVRNLDAYNRGEGWQGINGSMQGIGEAVNNGVAMVQGLYDEASSVGGQYTAGFKAGQPKPEDSKNTDQYLERYRNLGDLKTEVGKEVAAEFEQAKASISDENVSVDNNVGQLIEMHVILSKTLKAIDPYKKTSTKACKDQAQNKGGNCNGE